MQSRRTFMCGCLGAFAACSLFPGVTKAKMIDLLPPSDPADGKTFRVICLHDVRDNLLSTFSSSTMVDPFAVDTGTLTAIFSWLETNNYHPITVKQIEASRHGGKPLPPRAVLLTFDDGYRSHYTKVLPLLERFRYPAVMGIVTSWIDAPPDVPIKISDKVSVPRDHFMSWDDVRKLGSSDLIELACHTHNLHHGAIANPQGNELPATTSHLYLPDEKRYETDEEFHARVRNDLQTCIRQVRERTGITIRSMVWPYGAENQPVRDISTSLGMDIQFSLDAGPNTPDVPLDRLRRILMMYDVDIGGFERSMREPATNRGVVDAVERVVQVDLDQVYDPNPAQQERTSACSSSASTGCSRNRSTCRRTRTRRARVSPKPCTSRTAICRCARTCSRAPRGSSTRARTCRSTRGCRCSRSGRRRTSIAGSKPSARSTVRRPARTARACSGSARSTPMRGS